MKADKLAARFRAKAEQFTKKIEDLRRPRLDNTPKRQREAMSRHIDASRLERCRAAFLTMADAHERGQFPERFPFAGFAEVEKLLTRHIYSNGYYHVAESERYHDESEQAQAFRAWLAGYGYQHARELERNAEADRIKQLEMAVRFQDIPGFFPTPPALVARMIAEAGVREGMKVLEPSAGKGDIAEAVRDAGAQVVSFERSHTLCGILKAKGLSVECCDFLEMIAIAGFDRVLMNPPFEKAQDIDHVRHAFRFLKPGGRLVAVMSAGTMFRSDRKTLEFRDWLTEAGAVVNELPEDAFGEAFRSTKTRTILVVIDAEGSEPEAQPEAPAVPPPPAGCLF